MLRSNFVKFLTSIWNDQSIHLQILYSSSVSCKITPLYFFGSKNIYFPQNWPNKMNIFETLKSSGQNLLNFLCKFSNDESIPLQILYPSYFSWKVTLLYFKWTFLRLLRAQVKFRQVPYVNIKRRVNSSTTFVSLFSFIKDNPSLLVYLKEYTPRSKLAHSNENFWDFRVLRSKLVKFLM